MVKLIELRYSPTGPSANAFRHLSSPVAFTIMSRLDIGVISLIAELRGTNNWEAMAAEYFEGADPVTPMGKADRAHREERQGAGGMPDWAAWPVRPRTPYLLPRRARARHRFNGTSGSAPTSCSRTSTQ